MTVFKGGNCREGISHMNLVTVRGLQTSKQSEMQMNPFQVPKTRPTTRRSVEDPFSSATSIPTS